MTCKCGGEVYPDSYDPITRPVEWFMRCACGAIVGPIAATEEEAEALWLRDEAAA